MELSYHLNLLCLFINHIDENLTDVFIYITSFASSNEGLFFFFVAVSSSLHFPFFVQKIFSNFF